MTSSEKRNKAQYYRTLELMAVVSEEWGEAVQSINDYNWKSMGDPGIELDNLNNAIEELNQMVSPLLELQGLLETIVKLKKMEL